MADHVNAGEYKRRMEQSRAAKDLNLRRFANDLLDDPSSPTSVDRVWRQQDWLTPPDAPTPPTAMEELVGALNRVAYQQARNNDRQAELLQMLGTSHRRMTELVDQYVTDIRIADIRAAKWEQMYREQDRLIEKLEERLAGS